MTHRTVQCVREKTFTGRHMLACMVAFFGVIIVVNITMATLASRTWTGLVVKNSYVASQKFNARLQNARNQNARGWRSEVSYGRGVVRFNLADQSGAPVFLDHARLFVGRPAYEQQDNMRPLKHVGDGKYRADQYLAPGIWALQIIANRGAETYRRDIRLFVAGDVGKPDD